MANNRKLALAAMLLIIIVPLVAWQWPNISKFLTQRRLQTGLLATKVDCPLKADLCSKAQVLEVIGTNNQKQNFGLAWKLPEKTEILAAFDGTVTVQSSFGGKHPPKTYLLTNTANTYQAAYLFVPQRPFTGAEEEVFAKGKPVKQGEVLATVPGTTLDEMGYKDQNFQFYIVDLKRKARIDNLTPQNLGSLVLP